MAGKSNYEHGCLSQSGARLWKVISFLLGECGCACACMCARMYMTLPSQYTR